MMAEMKPLAPLDSGIVLIVGTKASNFDGELKNHPRIVMWDSQQQHWTTKDLPSNTRAIFMTRFLSHAAFGKIVAEARKKNITIFNPTGTGTIVRQVKELLNLTKPETPGPPPPTVVASPPAPEAVMPGEKGKLKPLIPLINFNMNNIDNARVLLPQATTMGIATTLGSLSQLVMTQRRRHQQQPAPKKVVAQERPQEPQAQIDVSVEILDGLIKGLQDMRQFLIETVGENRALRARLSKFKRMLEEDK